MKTITQNKIDSIYGFIIGDCLGVPYEFTKSNNIKSLKMIGHGSHDQLAGTWSDDTSFLLATLDSNLDDLETLKRNFKEILKNNKYTARNHLFDIGAATKQSIQYDFVELRTQIPQEGNGSMMRVLPYALLDNYDYIQRKHFVKESSYLTHNSRLAFECAFIYQELIRQSLKGNFDYIGIHKNILDTQYSVMDIDIYKVDKTGWCLGSLIITIFIASMATSYQDGIIQAINLGGDTDTHAALIGGLLAIKFKDFEKYKKQVYNIELADEIIDKFMKIHE